MLTIGAALLGGFAATRILGSTADGSVVSTSAADRFLAGAGALSVPTAGIYDPSGEYRLPGLDLDVEPVDDEEEDIEGRELQALTVAPIITSHTISFPPNYRGPAYQINASILGNRAIEYYNKDGIQLVLNGNFLPVFGGKYQRGNVTIDEVAGTHNAIVALGEGGPVLEISDFFLGGNPEKFGVMINQVIPPDPEYYPPQPLTFLPKHSYFGEGFIPSELGDGTFFALTKVPKVGRKDDIFLSKFTSDGIQIGAQRVFTEEYFRTYNSKLVVHTLTRNPHTGQYGASFVVQGQGRINGESYPFFSSLDKYGNPQSIMQSDLLVASFGQEINGMGLYTDDLNNTYCAYQIGNIPNLVTLRLLPNGTLEDFLFSPASRFAQIPYALLNCTLPDSEIKVSSSGIERPVTVAGPTPTPRPSATASRSASATASRSASVTASRSASVTASRSALPSASALPSTSAQPPRHKRSDGGFTEADLVGTVVGSVAGAGLFAGLGAIAYRKFCARRNSSVVISNPLGVEEEGDVTEVVVDGLATDAISRTGGRDVEGQRPSLGDRLGLSCCARRKKVTNRDKGKGGAVVIEVVGREGVSTDDFFAVSVRQGAGDGSPPAANTAARRGAEPLSRGSATTPHLRQLGSPLRVSGRVKFLPTPPDQSR